MPRHLAIANGRLHVAFDAAYQARELTWPHVGWPNHTDGHPFRFGVFTRGKLRWTSDPSVRVEMRYVPGTLVTDVVISHKDFIAQCRDAVPPDLDAWVREIRVRHPRGRAMRATAFLHHDFHIEGTSLGDTAAYDPAARAIVHYKRDRYFAIGTTQSVREFACGQKRFGHLEGTWRDAEDGRLSGNPMSHGSVDSTIAIPLDVPQGGEATVGYWVACGRTWAQADAAAQTVRAEGVGALLARAQSAHLAQAARAPPPPRDLSEEARALYLQSLALAAAGIDAGGGVVAAIDSDITSFNRDTYAYVWPRDGAFVAHALLLAGRPEVAERYLRFVARAFQRNRDVPPARGVGALLHKYTVDELLASSWHTWYRDGEAQLPIQEDETALTLWLLNEHLCATGDAQTALDLYRPLVVPLADFMVEFRDADALPLPSWDPWEERRGRLTYTACTVVAGLEAAARVAELAGDGARASAYAAAAQETRHAIVSFLYDPARKRFARMRGEDGRLDPTPDASLVALAWFNAFPPGDARVRRTLDHAFKTLWVRSRVGGIARYVNDHYHRVPRAGTLRDYPGNPWFVCTLWYADWLSLRARTPRDLAQARRVIAWAAARALPSGVLAEQLHPRTGAPLSVSPLTWSHAAYVASVIRYSEARARLTP